MTQTQSICGACAKHLGIRIGPRTGEYLLRHISSPQPPASVAVMGLDARTGVPLLTELPLAALRQNTPKAATWAVP